MLESEPRSAPQGHLIGAVCENQNLESGFKGKESLLGSQGQFSGQILGQLRMGKKITSRGKAREATPPCSLLLLRISSSSCLKGTDIQNSYLLEAEVLAPSIQSKIVSTVWGA